MPVYTTTDEFNTVMQALFKRLLDEGRLNQVDAKMRIYLTISQPAANVLINTRTTPPQVAFGPARGPFDLEVSMTGDTIHALWLRRLGVRHALAEGRIKLKGLPMRALALKPIFDAAEDYYPEVLAAHGRTP